MLTLLQKTLRGIIFGNANPHYDIPQLLSMYTAGKLRHARRQEHPRRHPVFRH